MSRINKYLADCGVASRRECDKLIQQGAVKINGKVAQLGDVVKEDDHVSVNGKRVALSRKCYIMLHKPKGCVTTAKDPQGRKTVMDFVDVNLRVFPVGRLDYDTEGLLLLTNDGEIANKIAHPANKVEKTYIARISGSLSEQQRKQLENGVQLDGQTTQPSKVVVLQKDEHHTRCSVTITEGRNRQVKRMFQAVGMEVEFLKRVSVGQIRLGGLQRGKWRFLNQKEIDYLQNLK